MLKKIVIYSLIVFFISSLGLSLSSIDIDSNEILFKFKLLELKYPNYVMIKDLGISEDGRPIYVVLVTAGVKELHDKPNFKIMRKHILFESGAHARERLNAILMHDLLEDFLIKGNFSILNESALHIIPLMNPDGYDIVLNGSNAIRDNELREYFEQKVAKGGDVSTLKANVKGIDLNRNYSSFIPFNGNMKDLFRNNTTRYDFDTLGLENYSGKESLNSETSYLADYILNNDFRFVISWHSRGEILFWDDIYFSPDHRKRSLLLAKRVKDINSYSLASEHNGEGFGCIGDFVRPYTDKPVLTIETQRDPFPVKQEYLARAFFQNRDIIKSLLENNSYLKVKLYYNGKYLCDFSDRTKAQFAIDLRGGDGIYNIMEYEGVPIWEVYYDIY